MKIEPTDTERDATQALELLAEAPWPHRGPKVTGVRTFLTAPQGCPYLIVRVETDEPGLYGLGCASDPQRTLAVKSVVDDYFCPMLTGRDVADVEDIHALLLNSNYWRGGSVQGNAIAAIDVALWDIKAKIAGLPLYSLLGGKAREYASAYTHVDGVDASEIADRVMHAQESGYRHVRIQAAVAGSDSYGTATITPAEQRDRRLRNGRWDSLRYLRDIPRVLVDVRDRVGFGVELLHDAHERLAPAEARQFVVDVAEVGLYFLEDVLAPEDRDWFPQLRAAAPTPLAVGELYGDVHDYLHLITTRSIDFLRIRIPTLGGLTPVRKLVAAGELFGIRIAPHGPGDVSPIGQAANLALDISAPNFGIQEAARFTQSTLEVFPGAYVAREGRLYPSERPGLGVDFDETAAARYPIPDPLVHDRWALLRSTDGSVQRP